MATQRISCVDPGTIKDDKILAELDRCRREGTPRSEGQAVRAHVPDCFWSFANTWRDVFHTGVCDHSIKELCRVYVSRSVKCEYRGNQRSIKSRNQGLVEEDYKDLLDFEHHQVLAGTETSMAPGFEWPQAVEKSKADPGYWARQTPRPAEATE